MRRIALERNQPVRVVATFTVAAWCSLPVRQYVTGGMCRIGKTCHGGISQAFYTLSWD